METWAFAGSGRASLRVQDIASERYNLSSTAQFKHRRQHSEVKSRAAIPLRDVQQSLQLELEEGKQGKTVVVKSVAAGSRAQQNGIVAGQQLLALSQISGEKFWTLDPDGIEEQDWIRAGRFAWDILDISSNEDLELVLSQPAAATSLLDEVESSQKGSQQQQSTIGDSLSSKYDEQYPDNPMVSALERRVKRRKERQEAEQKRNDVPFFLFLLGFFVVPPLVIILIAYSTGYLDSLSGHYTGTH
ncbi:hypothetical protein WJX74_007868 [Apatococcus lobatus]|uniref:PDZ domain-containing protein n=1 Tax=Apatococcus lobatus TaxID=904363 RepID=A0AAW1S3V8_9CHLO